MVTATDYTHRYAHSTRPRGEQPTESSQVYKVRAIIIPLVQMRPLRLERLSILINNPWSPHARTGLKHTACLTSEPLNPHKSLVLELQQPRVLFSVPKICLRRVTKQRKTLGS